MSDQIGIWIDRREAQVVRLSNGQSTSVRITSGVESQERRASDRTDGAFEPLQVPADDTRDRKETAELQRFYDEVIKHLKNADSVYICGPGEVRTHLRNRIAENRSLKCSILIEPADKLTEPQLIARVEKCFAS